MIYPELNPMRVIKLDKYTGKIKRPTLLLEDRSFSVLGNIPSFENFHFSFNGNALDEISFDVHKYTNGIKCPIWDKLEDLKIVEIKDYERFEIAVSCAETNEDVKTITGQSLECELGQVILREFHINDDDAMAEMEKTEFNTSHFDDNGNFIPTVFCNPADEANSLLHRALSGTAWKLGYVTPYVTMGKDEIAEPSNKFQRTYTEDGTSVYDFLTGTVAQETNVIFVFQTVERSFNGVKYPARTVHVFSLYDCKDDSGNLVASSLGEDTTILVSNRKLSKNIQINSNRDEVKNTFYVTGGDDVINQWGIPAVNMTGDNYIMQFAPFQLKDMPVALRDKITEYSKYMNSKETQDKYYGKNGLFTRYADLTDKIGYLTHSMMPDTSMKNTTAQEQFNKLKTEMSANDFILGICEPSWYNTKSYSTVTKNVEAYANVLVDQRYEVKVINNTTSITNLQYNDSTDKSKVTGFTWNGCLKITRPAKEDDVYPTETDSSKITANSALMFHISVGGDNVANNVLPYTEQKIYKALKTAKISDENFELDKLSRGTYTYRINENEKNNEEHIKYYTSKPTTYEKGDMYILDTNIGNFHKGDVLYSLSKSNSFNIESWRKDEVASYFNKYCLKELETFREAYVQCNTILNELKTAAANTQSEDGTKGKEDVTLGLGDKYYAYYMIVDTLYSVRTDEIALLNTELTEVATKKNEFSKSVQFQNWLNDDGLYNTFLSYIREDEYNNSNYTSDGLTTEDGYDDNNAILTKAKELIDVAKKELSKACMLQRTITTDLNNLLVLPEFEQLYQNFAMFNYIRVKTEDELFKMRLVNIEYDENSAQELTVTYSEQFEDLSGVTDDVSNILMQAASIATSYSSTTKQARQGSQVHNAFLDIKNSGLNTTNLMLKNSEDNEVTYSQSGILIRRKLDENLYDGCQSRLIYGGMYLTDDNWKTLRMAVGKVQVKNPINNVTSWQYGVICDALVGDLIVGEKMWIGNENGSVQITGEGIVLDGGKITWKKKLPANNTFTSIPNTKLTDADNHCYYKGDVWITEKDYAYQSGGKTITYKKGTMLVAIRDNTTFAWADWEEKVKYGVDLDTYRKATDDFNNKVQNSLYNDGTTVIGEDYMISPYLGGGYMYIKNKNDSRSVTIDPMELGGTKTSGYIFKITDKTGATTVGVKSDGSASFSGNVTAKSLTLGKGVKVAKDHVEHQSLSGYATEDWVRDRGYLTEHQSLSGLVSTDALTKTLGEYVMENGLEQILQGYAPAGNYIVDSDVKVTEKTDANGIKTTTAKVGNYTWTLATTDSDNYVIVNRGVGKKDNKDVFMLSKDGLLTANNAIIYGKVYATEGEFTGAIKSGSTITCGENFKVTADGTVTATAGNIAGWDMTVNGLYWGNKDQYTDLNGFNKLIDFHTPNGSMRIGTPFLNGNTPIITMERSGVVTTELQPKTYTWVDEYHNGLEISSFVKVDGQLHTDSNIGCGGGLYFPNKTYFAGATYDTDSKPCIYTPNHIFTDRNIYAKGSIDSEYGVSSKGYPTITNIGSGHTIDFYWTGSRLMCKVDDTHFMVKLGAY